MVLLKLVINCNLLLCLVMITINDAAASNEIVKKVLTVDSGVASEIKFQKTEKQSVHTDKTPKQAVKGAEQIGAANKDVSTANDNKSSTDTVKQRKQPLHTTGQPTITPKDRWQNTLEETNFNRKEPNFDYDEDDLPDSYLKGFYVFLALSGAAMLFIVVKVYRLRLSRAERKYGVQGDRSTQELVPLPVSVEDSISEDEDQTLFEVNRQQIRIL